MSKTKWVNGVLESVLYQDHALMREALKAMYWGEMKDFCKKYNLEYDNVYTTPFDAILAFIDDKTFLHIEETGIKFLDDDEIF